MFGERYFATRERLSAVVAGVQQLAKEAGVEPERFREEEDFLSALTNPFLFVVCGEVNAGKSTFINGLFGRELCEVNILPQTSRVQWYRYGEEEREEFVTDVLEERYRKMEFLQDFNIVDTPGTNSVERGHQSITERFLPVADLILFVFPVTNPWGAATWDFIASHAKDLKGKLVLVIQQSDQREEKDIVVIREHLKDLAIQRIGEAPEVFAVSGKQAFEAKECEPIQTKLWRESGFPEMEQFISRVVTDSPERKRVLREIRDASSATLRQIEERLERGSRNLEGDKGFLRELEAEVEHERERHAQRLGEKFSGLGKVFGDQAREAANLIRSRTSLLRSVVSLFRKDETSSEIEKGFIEAVKEAIEQKAENDGDELLKTCGEHWESVVPRLEERLGFTAPKFNGDSDGFQGAKERFAKRLGRASRKAVVEQKMRTMLDLQMESRRGLLRRYVALTLMVVAVAGILGALVSNWAGLVLLGVAALVFGVGLVKARATSNELVKWFEEKAASSRTPFVDALVADYKEGVRGFFVEYAGLFEGVRRHLAQQKRDMSPLLERCNELYIELKTIDHDL
ncbi:MAG: dynamin family protein [Verrucomicrobiota bacterium]